jgi:tetratricopeptide (TPR) repeat protein
MFNKLCSKIFCLCVICGLFSFFAPASVFSETKIFEKEYAYQASEDDSKNSSKTIALREVKRLLLEELGMYLEVQTEVKNFQLTKDQINILTAGIVKTEILDERWDGKVYWLKASISADPNLVASSINSLRKDREKTKELEEIQRKASELLRENEQLKKELKIAQGKEKEQKQREYRDNIKMLTSVEWFEKGFLTQSACLFSGDCDETITAFSKAIELNPKYIEAYNARGEAYNNVKKYQLAITDFTKIIELEPENADAYYSLSATYLNLKKYKQALAYINKAIGLNPQEANYYVRRGIIHFRVDNYQKALDDYQKAVEIKPTDYNHFILSDFYIKTGNYKQAVAPVWVLIPLSLHNGTNPRPIG